MQKSNYAAVEALALSLVLALSATSEVLALSEALADSEVLADAEVLAGSEALVLAGSDTDVLDGAVEAGALEEEESVPQATRDSAISAATARTRTFFIVKTSIFSILYTASPARAAECCARAFVKAVSDYSIFCVKDKMFFVHFNEL